MRDDEPSKDPAGDKAETLPAPAASPAEDAILSAVRSEIRVAMGQLSEAIDAVRHEFAADIRGLQGQMEESTNRQLNAHETTRRHVAHMSTMTQELWREVFGDKPAPPPPNKDATLSFTLESSPDVTKQTGKNARMRERVESQEGTLAALHGQMLAMDGRQDRFESELGNVKLEVGAVKTDVAAVKTEVGSVKTDVADVKTVANETLALQKEQMGKKGPGEETRGIMARIADGILYAVREREGQKFLLLFLSGLTGFLTVASYLYALIAGHPPPPLAPPSAVPTLQSAPVDVDSRSP